MADLISSWKILVLSSVQHHRLSVVPLSLQSPHLFHRIISPVASVVDSLGSLDVLKLNFDGEVGARVVALVQSNFHLSPNLTML